MFRQYPSRPEHEVEATTDAGARFREALANLHKSGLPRYVSPSESSWQSPQPEAPPTPPRAAAPTAPAPLTADDQPRLMHRRNTLAQSRRLGLGAPIRREGHEASDDGDGDGSPDAEPAAVPHPPAAPPPPPLPPLPEPTHDAPPEPPGGSRPFAGSAPSERPPLEPVVVPGRPIVDGTGRPAAATAPLRFRARPTRPQLGADRQTVQRAVVTRPPAELAHALRSSHGIDVTDVPVQRDTAAGSEARQQQARAFTRGGRVFLPEEAGHLSSAQTRGLLAHELVHVAQQRRLGHALPDPDSDEGRGLELEALQAERMYSSASTQFEEPTLIHAPHSVTPGWVETRITQYAKDYFDPVIESSLTNDQRTKFDQSSSSAVQETMSGRAGNTFADSGELLAAQQTYLDVLNRELRQLGQDEQSSLSDRDLEQVARLLSGNSSSSGAGGNNQEYEYRRDSTTAGGFFDNLFGGSTVTMPNQGNRAGQQGQPGTQGQQAGGTGQSNQPGASGGPRGQILNRSGSGGTNTQTDNQQHRRDSRSAGGFFDNLFGGDVTAGADISGVARFFGGGNDAATSIQLGGTAASRDAANHPPAHQDQSHQQGQQGTQSGQGHQARLRSLSDEDQESEGETSLDLDERELDELTKLLYDRLRSRLRRELLVDRERAGLLTDFR
jgi:hypothetical protein